MLSKRSPATNGSVLIDQLSLRLTLHLPTLTPGLCSGVCSNAACALDQSSFPTSTLLYAAASSTVSRATLCDNSSLSRALNPQDSTWLSRYHKADQAGIVFEQQVGFNCGLTLDDMGHISVGMDAMHECLLELLDLVLMKDHITTVIVPRVLPAYKLFEPKRRLPLCTWNQFITVYSKAEALFENSLNNKAWPLMRSLAITSNLTLPKSGKPDAVKKCKWCQGPHFTCDCPSPERAAVGPCRAHLAGRCRNGGKHCKYKHLAKEKGKTNESHLTGNNSQDNSQDTHEKKSSAIDPGTTLVGAANGSQKPKQVPDDFPKAQTRVCSIKERAKTFTIPLEGDKGTKWYEAKGLFLPKRCEKCIEAGITNWNPSDRQKESQLSQQDPDDSTDDPDDVDSLLTMSLHDAENANITLQPQSSFGAVLPANDQSYAVSMQSDALFEYLGNRVAPVRSNTLMADCKNETSKPWTRRTGTVTRAASRC